MKHHPLVICMVAFLLTSCLTATQHHNMLPTTQERRLTLGLVQKHIKVGVDQAEVATVLGSPNIVTQDGEGHECWIYDKIATESAYSNSSSGIGLAGVAASVTDPVAGGGFIGHKQGAGASSTTQRTLTVVIKFDEAARVTSVKYHSSKF